MSGIVVSMNGTLLFSGKSIAQNSAMLADNDNDLESAPPASGVFAVADRAAWGRPLDLHQEAEATLALLEKQYAPRHEGDAALARLDRVLEARYEEERRTILPMALGSR